MVENVQETCRTCLLVRPETVNIKVFIPYSCPRETYADILENLAKLEFVKEQECKMPQNICSECCRQLRQMYLFVKQVHECNNKLFQTFGQITESLQEPTVNIKSENHVGGYSTSLKPDFVEVTLENPISVGEVEDTNFEEEIEDVTENVKKTYSFEILNIYSAPEENQKEEYRMDKCDSSSSCEYPNIFEFEPKETVSDAEYLRESPIPNEDSESKKLSNISNGVYDTTYNKDTQEKIITSINCPRNNTAKGNLEAQLIHKLPDSMRQDKYTMASNKIKCSLCDYTARTHAAFHFHRRSKHGTEDDKVKCKFCSYSSLQKFDLLQHIKKSHLSTIKTLKKNLRKRENTGNTSSEVIESINDISDFVHKIQDESIKDPIENKSDECKEVCSSGDEDLIREILNIKKRGLKSNSVSSSRSFAKGAENNNIASNDTICPLCEQILEDHNKLLSHMLMKHNENSSSANSDTTKSVTSNKEKHFACDHCPKKFSNKYKRRIHLTEKHNIPYKISKTKPKYTIEQKVIRCRLCDYTTKTHASLHYHTRSKHGTEDDKIKCNFCAYTCFKKFDLLQHTKKSHLATVKAIKMNIAINKDTGGTLSTEVGTDASSKENITSLIQKYQEISNVDANENNEEVFSSDEDTIRYLLNMKRRIPKSESTSSFARRCEECGNVYKNSIALNVHIRMVHGEHVYSQCPHCERKYKRPYDLKKHIMGKHTPEPNNETLKTPTKMEREKRFMCTECSYICATSTLLTIHTNRHHSGEKPYKCEFCSKAFFVPFDLKTHRYLHTGERPFKCSVCLKGFRDKNHMHRHKRIHSDVKPYNCTDCGKGFTKNYNLTIHKRTHMKGQRLKCLVCNKYFNDRALLNVHQISENHHEEVV